MILSISLLLIFRALTVDSCAAAGGGAHGPPLILMQHVPEKETGNFISPDKIGPSNRFVAPANPPSDGPDDESTNEITHDKKPVQKSPDQPNDQSKARTDCRPITIGVQNSFITDQGAPQGAPATNPWDQIGHDPKRTKIIEPTDQISHDRRPVSVQSDSEHVDVISHDRKPKSRREKTRSESRVPKIEPIHRPDSIPPIEPIHLDKITNKITDSESFRNLNGANRKIDCPPGWTPIEPRDRETTTASVQTTTPTPTESTTRRRRTKATTQASFVTEDEETKPTRKKRPKITTEGPQTTSLARIGFFHPNQVVPPANKIPPSVGSVALVSGAGSGVPVPPPFVAPQVANPIGPSQPFGLNPPPRPPVVPPVAKIPPLRETGNFGGSSALFGPPTSGGGSFGGAGAGFAGPLSGGPLGGGGAIGGASSFGCLTCGGGAPSYGGSPSYGGGSPSYGGGSPSYSSGGGGDGGGRAYGPSGGSYDGTGNSGSYGGGGVSYGGAPSSGGY